jgi:hypothetical protein
MGEAKLKQRTLAAMMAASPDCIYCAGANRATTIEHIPPIHYFTAGKDLGGLSFQHAKAATSRRAIPI